MFIDHKYHRAHRLAIQEEKRQASRHSMEQEIMLQRNTAERLRIADLIQKQIGPLNRGTLAVTLSTADALVVYTLLEKLER